MAGRKPVPTALKVLRGNPGKRPLNKNEPKPKPAIPKCPDHLADDARREWRRMARKLHQLGLLTEIDGGALAAYCAAYGRWVEAEQKIRETGTVVKTKTGYPILNPYLQVANTAINQMKAFLTEFGMTPSSRSRIKVPQDDGRDEDDAFFCRRG